MTIDYQLADINSLAQKIIAAAGNEKIWFFEGEMGAGKTTLIKALCQAMGVAGHIQSPTFSIVNEYEAEGTIIYHFDCYRLKNEEEAYDIGLEEYLDSGNFCWIEWPDKIESFWPEKYIFIKLEKSGEFERKCIIEII
jgi:tRNA threonylcarbamoyladenosine biosynthesis protein TsaE